MNFLVNQVCESLFQSTTDKDKVIGILWNYKEHRYAIFEWLYLNHKDTFYKYLPNIVGMSRINQDSIHERLSQYVRNVDDFQQYYTRLRKIISDEEFNNESNWKFLTYLQEKYHDSTLEKEIITLYKYKKT